MRTLQLVVPAGVELESIRIEMDYFGVELDDDSAAKLTRNRNSWVVIRATYFRAPPSRYVLKLTCPDTIAANITEMFSIPGLKQFSNSGFSADQRQESGITTFFRHYVGEDVLLRGQNYTDALINAMLTNFFVFQGQVAYNLNETTFVNEYILAL